MRLLGVTSLIMVLGVAARLAGAQTAPQKAAPAGAQPQYWFGVAVENIPPTIARQLKLQSDQGVMVVAVLPGSPAEKAGLRADDLLIELNGKPLTSQEELARAANTVKVEAAKTPPTQVQSSEIVYLRSGDRAVVRIMPERRPISMAVSGRNPQSFTPQDSTGAVGSRDVRNYTLPNGSTVYVGPGYQVDTKSQGTSMRVLREAVGNGDTVVMTQESDEAGNSKTTISDGKNSYPVEAGKLDRLPANLRPLAEQMLSGAAGVKATGALSTDERLQVLEKQNEDLRKQLDEVKQLLMKNGSGK